MRTGSLFAVKKLVLDGAPQSQVSALQREISVLQKLKHENIVRYLGTERAKRVLCIFLEYVPGGSISSMLNEFGAFPESLIRRYTKQILRGVCYLHSRNIVHRDIKGANVLISDVGRVKLADFGCSKQLAGLRTNSLDESLKALRGSVPWMAPEVIRQTGHSCEADMWSVGATVLEMVTAQHPWPDFQVVFFSFFNVGAQERRCIFLSHSPFRCDLQTHTNHRTTSLRCFI
jgi:mitogen-activated protein kinase kinase kinase ANP1